MPLIGIDLGTSFIKGAVLDLDSLRISHIKRVPFPAPLPGLPPLFREFDPAQIMSAVHSLLDDLIPAAGHCEGIVMCAQMHSLVFTTERGEARSNLSSWLDQRVLMPHPSGGTYFEVMLARLTAEERQQVGNELRPGLPAGNLFWLAERGELPSEKWIVASMPDFVVANLCENAPSTDLSHALSHGSLNLETLDWHQSIIAKLGLDRLCWPQIRQHGEIVGYLPSKGQRIPCFTPVGDFQCAIAGSLLRQGELSLNISTGSQVSLLKPCLELGNFQTRPFFDGLFLNTIVTIPAGRALTALVKLLTELANARQVTLSDPWDYIARRATEVDSTRLRVNLAFFNSAVGNEGEIAHLREEEMTVGHLFRAAFEGMAENYFTLAQRLSPQQGWDKLVFSGGLVQKIELLRDLISEKFQRPSRLSPTAEDTMLGLIALGMAFTGRSSSVTQAMQTLFEQYRE